MTGDWDLKWSYSCNNLNNSGNFIVTPKSSGGAFSGDNIVNQLGSHDDGTEHYHNGTGERYLEVVSECDWSLDGGGTMTMADSAFRQGIVGKVWVGLLLDLTQTNGFASRARVYIVRPGGNGTPLINAGLISAEQEGDRMDAFFASGRLYVTNEIYLPGEAHCCATRSAVQVFGVNSNANELVLLGVKTVPIGASKTQIIEAMRR